MTTKSPTRVALDVMGELSAAKLVQVWNAITDGKPKNKFESTPRGYTLTMGEIERMGLTVHAAMVKAGLLEVEAPAPEAPIGAGRVINLATGEVMPPLKSLHGPLRDTPANPAKAAKAVAKAAAKAAGEAHRAASEAAKAASKPAPTGADLAPPRADWLRTNKTVPLMVEAMREGGRTLTELQKIGLWGAPVELRHLRKIATMAKVTIVPEGGEGAERRYRVAG